MAIIDIVSRKWITTVTSAEESSTQVEVAFTQALEAEGLWDAADARATDALVTALVAGDRAGITAAIDDGQLPLLPAISDNGAQMRSHTTREFLAGVAIAQQFGRPGTPTDQAWIETLFGHVKAESPHLEKIKDPAALEAELDHVTRPAYDGVRLHAGIGYVTHPTTNTKDEVTRSGKPAATDSTAHASTASNTVETRPTRRTNDHPPALAGYFNPRLVN